MILASMTSKMCLEDGSFRALGLYFVLWVKSRAEVAGVPGRYRMRIEPQNPKIEAFVQCP